MEESEKRKERLKAMRLQASSSSSSPSQQQQLTQKTSLSNPLLETPLSNPPQQPPQQPPRFDYYTDPMSAYSSVKPRPFSPSFQGPRNPEMRSVGAPQFHHNYAPHQGMYQGGHSPGMPSPSSSPIGIRSQFPMQQGDPSVSPAPARGPWFNNYPSPGSGCGGTPYPAHQVTGSPNFRSPQGRGHWSNNSPNPNLGCGGGPSPGPGRGGGPSPGPGRGRGQWHDSRMSPHSGYSGGRGRGGGRMSPSAGYSGGRGRGGGHQGRSFYHTSMVEDPWESLTPVLWQGLKDDDVRIFAYRQGPFKGTPSFHKTPFQKTPITKKPRFSNPFDASNSKPSLAEFLSESFEEDNEAVEDASTLL